MTDWQNDKLIYGEECELPPESWMRILRPRIVLFFIHFCCCCTNISKIHQMRYHKQTHADARQRKKSEHSKECQLMKHLLSLPIFTLTHGCLCVYAEVQSRHRIFIIERDKEWRDRIKSAVAMWFFVCNSYLPFSNQYPFQFHSLDILL